MVFVKKGHSSPQQWAYARRVFSGDGQSKKSIALDCGYSPNVANSVASHIESKPGFNYAMSKLAADSNNLAISVMDELKARGFKDYENKELVSALNAISNAWSKFNKQGDEDPIERTTPNSKNKLRNVIMQQVENQTIIQSADAPPTPQQEPIPGEVVEDEPDNPMDF